MTQKQKLKSRTHLRLSAYSLPMRVSAAIPGSMLMEGWAALGENLTPAAAAGQGSVRHLQLRQSCSRNHVGP